MSSEYTSYSRQDYDRYVDRVLGWTSGGAACVAAGSLVSLRHGLSARTLFVSLAGAAACFGMALYETLQDFRNSRR